MANSKDREKLVKFAKELYSEIEPMTEHERLQVFLDECTEYNLTVFLSSFVCHDLFGHSQPDTLTGKDVELFMKHADFFLQTVILQQSMKP
ncbi:hypothetical protein [uncultured Roseibium sp.]|uniref:hypothetical protein n=1 Tax=uncultured Roseibium sp. TaxID=1936171 RepID=UPI00261A91A2|nr:hypothetical protein [uncultured Roseibium sp.]